MRFFYGTKDKKVNVTEILFRKRGKINQSYNSLFGDPIPRVRKTLFWMRNGKETVEFNEDQPISLNIDRHEVIWNYEKFKQNYVKQKGIPKYMIRTGPYELEDLPESFYNLIIETKEQNPEYQQVYFNDLDCLLFIKENYPQHLLEYEALVPGRYKADFFRALFLYKYGGVYNDLGHKYFVPVSEIIENNAMVLVADRIGIYNGFMASRPARSLLFYHVQLMAKRIREKDHADNPLCITGPGCFWNAFCAYYNYSGSSLREVNRYEGIKIIHYSDIEETLYDNYKPVIKINNYREILYKNKKHYAQLWHEKKVYKTIYGIWDYKTFKEKYSYSGQGIPKIMVRTYRSPIRDLINPLYLLIKKIEEDNPEYQQVYFDDHDCLSFVEENFPQYLPEYNVLIPGAYKADLFRVLFLYKYGGIYSDITLKYLIPVDEIIGNSRLILITKWEICNDFITCQPGEGLIKVYIELMVERIRSKSYCLNPLDITGPTCFRDAFVKYFNHPPEEFNTELEEYKWTKLYHFDVKGAFIMSKNTRIIKTRKYHDMIYPDRKPILLKLKA